MKSLFIFDNLSKFIGGFVVFFTFLIFVYSLGFIKKKKASYYFWFFLTFLASLGVVFSSNFVLILIFWGFLGLTLFMLINLSDDRNALQVAKKTFMIVGGCDGFLLLGFLILGFICGEASFNLSKVSLENPLAFIAFICIASGAFAKAGLMPFHTWIPDASQSAPLPVVAYLPASVDKLLGIYLLVRIIKDVFILNTAARVILLILGALTIVAAVMMALIQHNVKRLLGFHAVSQVGYMVLGLATGNVVGIAGGLFHMLNHAIYKACLFLSAGNVEKKTGSSELDDLGGLASFMPVTFATMSISALAISGIPPFNGFVSKWMVYQGLVGLASNTQSMIIKIVSALALVFALIGSGLTLASFLKLSSGIFLGKSKTKVKEVGPLLYFSPVVLSLLCIIFGVFAYQTALRLFIEPSLQSKIYVLGLYRPTLTTLLIMLGIGFGFLLFFSFTFNKKIKLDTTYIGGEELKDEVKPEDFYKGIKELKGLVLVYKKAEEKYFDVYEVIKKIVLRLTRIFRHFHNGVLPTYLVWCLIAMVGLFLMFMR